MTRSEVRTQSAWGAFDRAAFWIVPIVLILLLLLLPMLGYGPNNSGCCGSAVASSDAPPPPKIVAAPAPAPAPAQPAVAVAPPPATTSPPATAPVPIPAPAPTPAPAPVAEVKVDCNTIMQGVAVNFAKGGAQLSDAGKRALDQVIACLKDGNYEVAGHTDSDGGDALNQRLSEARAKSVVQYLLGKGIAAERLIAVGYGETKPIADNATTEGKAKNRRIAFTRK